MAKSTTEATQKASKKNPLSKVPEERYERPLMNPPEEDQPENDHDPGPLPEKELGPLDQLRLAKQIPKIVITHGKILKDKVAIEFTQQNDLNEKPAKGTWEDTKPPRDEFQKSFDDLIIHACLLGEFIPYESVADVSAPDPELIKNFTVTGISIQDEGKDKEGVNISAYKTLSNGKTMGLNIPTVRFQDSSEKAYPFLDKLAEQIELCKKEIKLYLNGKHLPNPQLSLAI